MNTPIPHSSKNPVTWFDLPVMNMDRAVAFYGAVLGVTFERKKLVGFEMAFFPSQDGATGSSGVLIESKLIFKPSNVGALLYFAAPSGDLTNELALVKANGGTIVLPRMKISDELGFMAIIGDTEGNHVALHSPA